jgi:CheY-like chemotaxis protein
VRAQPFLEEALRWLPEAQQSASLPGDAPLQSGTDKRVLLADDNADMREYVSRLLRGQGYEVTTTNDGQAALDQARSASFDLILTDVMMPRLDGFGLLRAIRTDRELASTPVIMLSARADAEATVKASKLAPTTISPNPLRPANCWPASTPISRWLRCVARRRAPSRSVSTSCRSARSG